MAPSPSVFLAAVAERTRAAAVRAAGLADAASPSAAADRGNLHARPAERRTPRHRVRTRLPRPSRSNITAPAPQDAQEIYAEAVELVIRDDHKVLDFKGGHFTFSGVPMEIEPLQKPHPPIWYGVHTPDSAERAARRGLNVVSLDRRRDQTRHRALPARLAAGPCTRARCPSSASAASSWWRRPTPRPGAGASRLPVWHASFTHLFRRHGRAQSHPRPATFDLACERGQGIAGSPATVAVLADQLLRPDATTWWGIRLRRPRARGKPAIDRACLPMR